MNRHVEQHHLHRELEEYGVTLITENPTIKWFQDGIKDPQYKAVHTAVSIDPSHFPTFDSVKDVYLSHSRTVIRTREAAAARDHHGVSSTNELGGDCLHRPCRDKVGARNAPTLQSTHANSFHPVDADHTSATCKYKIEGHRDDATWTNRLGGNMYWPVAKAVTLTQHNHVLWKDKSAPTN
jgi:hypothetical protein